MLNEILSAAELVFTLENIIVMVAGIWFGVIVGSIPGMTGTMAVTLALPFTFYMPPITSILLLVALYKGSTYGASISAILIKTPGTASAACTVLDGYPLAQQGKANTALKAALYSSCIGDFISNIALIFLAIPLAAYALLIGPPEYFLIMVIALFIISGVSEGNLRKGILSACLGLILATVGQDIYGSYRFAFNENLQSKLNVVPVLIGLFAIPEVLKLIMNKGEGASPVMKVKKTTFSLRDLKSSSKAILKGSTIGVVLGAIPGIGPASAAFFSYSEAKRSSKNPEEFGHGSIEGIAASESANNGCCGATMIPLLALGIPGDVITGVMLGAFMIHGINPGPLLFETNINLIYSLFIGILLSSFILFFAGSITARMFSHIVKLPKHYLFPCVLVLCLFGIYSVTNNTFDIAVLLVMGGLGYFMMSAKIPTAPFLIAFIIGPMLEENLRRSLSISRGELGIFTESGISKGLVFVIVCFVLISIIKLIKHRSQKQKVTL
ncbi:tripartite tricarboxylate transporter permease (plasmid) [Photobacterium sp. GJ3]|uniref:tripartite tricarboxylate transporter permease n=1 Tax=Photobacterium sp. GJ3 TaxID=2829502 RepID=UPI001B8C7F2C|nr:tripartite tricarboxylate transporter permease [Photobacterium sp. GJ3]QUJ70234.1 tripartite tricarboxylate transporter permease [Photobacterium sp. GJ3]